MSSIRSIGATSLLDLLLRRLDTRAYKKENKENIHTWVEKITRNSRENYISWLRANQY